MPTLDRHVLAARDVSIRKPLSSGWHAELPAAFYQHDIYREYSDGTRMHMGTLTIEAVEAWQRAAGAKRKTRHTPAQIARIVMAALAEAMERELAWTEIEAKHPARFKAVRDAVRDAVKEAL